MMEKVQWAYQNVLKENRVENKFDHFLRYLLHMLDRKYAKTVGMSISQNINLHPGSDCALVYNPQGSMKYPKLVLHIPSLYESGGDDSPHFVMMAVIAKMILDKDQDFDSLISKKVSYYIAAFEKEKGKTEAG
ncbi:MAG: hypothetical protein CO013_09050 [Syntrophobacterales bacterium CG_4_8_14_3_um_filter_58_8]|nr:MAG: hypothetical protein AUK26_14575 [Syntrophaceae bacterium CG2_30_58_14]PIV07123.1 MAG: hypothetical protein COS57_01050 [Syntrophobacterales bacterium CG03_land_8_20_14_0_80_58_14]PJC72504.1 MAG: hypothetical protein CO013_09050 [Syntrophobacterales bacterium CG_4_8_14_3_um_filter_58_8]